MHTVHLWAPDLFSTGGIQTFSRHFLDALGEQVPSKEIRVLLKSDLPEVARCRNGLHHVNTFGGWPKILRTPRFTSACVLQAWRERPRLIISMHLNFGPVAQLVKEIVGVPYVLVAHGIDAWRLKNRARKKSLHGAERVLAVSRYTRERLIQATDLDPQRVHILPNTFSAERFVITRKSPRLLERYGFNAQTPIILTVCRLAGAERYKGYDQMIRALPHILRHVPDARYLLVGSGPDRSRAERLAVELNVQHAVVFAGLVPDEELSDYYNLCDLFAMPSKAEGFGIVYLEALACGKPVLAGNKDGSCDALADGELGLLVDPDDTAEIASETVRVLRRQHTHLNLFRPEILRQRVTEQFGYDRFKDKVADRLRPFLEATADNRPLAAEDGRSAVISG